jgi:hypothetical protein
MFRKRIHTLRLLGLAAALLIGSSLLRAADASSVKVWETKAVIPTYLAGAPEPNPMFFFGRSSQGAAAVVAQRDERAEPPHRPQGGIGPV